MLPEYVKDDPVGYHVSASRPGDGGGYTEGLVKAYNDQHGTVLVRFDDGEEAWYGPEDKLMFLQPSVASSYVSNEHSVDSLIVRPKHPPPDNPLQWKVRVASGKQGRVVGYSAPLAQILMGRPLSMGSIFPVDISPENGLTVEWLRVFSIPSKFQRLYDDQCKSEGRVPDQEDFIRFLTALVRSNMPTVAASVYKFCDKAAHVPRLWCYPPVAGSVNEWSTIPDPESHLIGFILTPRAALPKHLTRADIQDLTDLFTPDLSMTLLKKAQVVQASLASPANRFALYEALKEDPLLELLLEDHPPLAGLLQTFEMEAAISWRDLFGYLSTRIHVDILTKTWGADLMPELLRLFVSLIPAFEDTESPVQLVMALTHLRRLEVPPAPKPSGTNPRRKASKGDHRISLAIVSAQEAVRALKAIQAKHHAESSFQKHLSDVNTITTYVSQNAQKLHDQVLQHAYTPLVLTPLCTNLDEIVSSMQDMKHQTQQDKELAVSTNKERLQDEEKQHQAAVDAKKLKWQLQCDAIEAQKQQKKQATTAKNEKKAARVRQERQALARRRDQEVRKLEQKVAKIMQSPRHAAEFKPVLKPHPPPKPRIPETPKPPTVISSSVSSSVCRPQSARVVRDRTVAFGNMVSKLHSVEVTMKKEQTKAMWRHVHSENKRFQPPAPLSVSNCVAIESKHKSKLLFKSSSPPTNQSNQQPMNLQRAITSLDLPLANEATCIKLASDLIPPAVKPPDIDDDSSNSYCVMAKYNRTLDDDQRQVFKARFSSNHVKLNHRLSYAVQEQYVHMARRNQAWGAFCASSRIYSDDPEQLKRTEFATVAKKVGKLLLRNLCILSS
ncbi:hypothetical protein DYB25_004027 [Aphanomyces astaci]|uniref:Uncharacterized protein n=1 Tax=Aphanomyces astaci TaxID=112090 RepID=A0A397B2L6_APHAT|nr:hypothetical protein DYB25_004027 [Aphanomyces astaci]